MPSHLRSFQPRVLPASAAVLLLALGGFLSLPLHGANPPIPAGASSAPASAADRIALAVVFDTSGSMRSVIPTAAGSPAAPKLEIARRAFATVIERLQVFSMSPGAKPLVTGIYVFRGNEVFRALPLAPFHPATLRTWLAQVQANSATPLGAAIALAGRDLLATPAAARHLLVLTDGANSTGPKPEVTLAELNAAATAARQPVFVHVIALDIKPAVFAALQKQGATLIGATNGAQLNEQFDFILEEKILVEAPRPAR